MLKKSQKYNSAIATATAVIGSTVIGVTSAQAATFTYDLTRTPNINRSTVILSDTSPLPSNTTSTAFLAAPVGAPTLTLTAIKPGGGSGNVFVGQRGVGVVGNPRGNNIGADSNGSEELIFNFSRNVVLKSATFSRAGNDTLLNTTGFGLKDENGDVVFSSPNLNGNTFFEFTTPFTGSTFSFFARNQNDRFVVRDITVATVPESSSVLGLLGIGVLGLASKKLKISKI